MWVELGLTCLVLLFFVYRYITKKFGYWEKFGIPVDKGYFPLGSYNLFSGKHFDDITLPSHLKYKDEPFFGWFLFGKPTLAINDAEIIKMMQVKDFDAFVDRMDAGLMNMIFSGGDMDQLWAKQLTSITGDEWKAVRSAFTPIFTSGKMKGMFKFIKHVSGYLVDEMNTKAENGDEFELKDVFGKFSIDALASSAFGVDGQSFTNKDSPFVKNAAIIFGQSMWDFLVISLKFVPGVGHLMNYFEMNTFKPKESRFFVNIIRKTIEERKASKVRKNDLVDLMLDCIKQEDEEASEDDSGIDDQDHEQYDQDMKLKDIKKGKHNLDESTVIATALVLLTAGYDTTGMTLSYVAYEMANNPDVQKKLQEEIDEAFEEAGGKMPDYNVIQSLPYLDMVINETLRVHPPVGTNTRTVTKDSYTIPGTNLTLKRNDLVSWHARHLHRDPKHWEKPDEFYPEHFSKEAKASRNPYAFQAFGQGPRACIGMRFALLEAKVAVLDTFRNVSLMPGTKTKLPLELDFNSQLAWVKGGLWVTAEKREDI